MPTPSSYSNLRQKRDFSARAEGRFSSWWCVYKGEGLIMIKPLKGSSYRVSKYRISLAEDFILCTFFQRNVIHNSSSTAENSVTNSLNQRVRTFFQAKKITIPKKECEVLFPKGRLSQTCNGAKLCLHVDSLSYNPKLSDAFLSYLTQEEKSDWDAGHKRKLFALVLASNVGITYYP